MKNHQKDALAYEKSYYKVINLKNEVLTDNHTCNGSRN